jgi:CheY-like chemotaxis protein
MLAERLPARVVLIADEEPLQRHVTALLSQSFADLDVRGARDADEAMDLLEDEQSRLLITDAQARRLDGLALAERAHSRRPELPVIVMSSAEGARASASSLPPTAAWLDKPPHAESLVGLVRNCLVKPAGFSGKLELDNLPELVQFLCMSNVSGALSVEAVDQRGLVYFERGAIIDAISGRARGVEAFHEMLRWRAGVFALDRRCHAERRTIELTSMQLLLDGTRLLDQEQALGAPRRSDPDAARVRTRALSQTRLRVQPQVNLTSKPTPRPSAKPSQREVSRSDPPTLRTSNQSARATNAPTSARGSDSAPTAARGSDSAPAPRLSTPPPIPAAVRSASTAAAARAGADETSKPKPKPSAASERPGAAPRPARTAPPSAANGSRSGGDEASKPSRARPATPSAANDNRSQLAPNAATLPLWQRLPLTAAESPAAPAPAGTGSVFGPPAAAPPLPRPSNSVADAFASPPPSESALRDLAARSFQRGMEFAIQKQYAEAVREWQQAIQLEPDNRTYRTNLRRLHEVMRRTSQGDTRADEE